MTDAVVIIILLIIIGCAVTYMVKAKRRGVKCIGCPAGGSCSAGKIKRKKLNGMVVGKKTMKIAGMHCQHCVINITNALNQLDGVQAEVSLSKGAAVITYDREMEEEILINTVENAGYKVIGIS